MSGLVATVHVAGPPQLGGLFQDCARCGHVLQDYTGSEVMVSVEPGDTAPPTIGHWQEGGRIAQVGNATYVVPARPLDDDERECRPAS